MPGAEQDRLRSVFMEDSFEVKVELVEIVVGNHSTHPLRLYDLGAKNWLDENMH